MSIKETTIQLSTETNASNFETYVNRLPGVERAMIELDSMIATIEYDSDLTTEEQLKRSLSQY